MKPISAVIFEVDDTLTSLGVQYVFGGALALAYYAQPRGTIDIDLCVSTRYESRSTLLDDLSRFGWLTDQDEGGAPIAGTRLRREGESVVLDVFFSFDPYHADVLNNAVRNLFVFSGERRELPFLSADDLAVLKISFGRDKDWVDLRAMSEAGTPIDIDYVERQLVNFKGPTAYPAAARLRALLARYTVATDDNPSA